MINYVAGIQSVILKFQLDLYGDNSLNCIETAAFIKIKLKTHGMIKDIMKYENEFKNVLGDNAWLEAKNGYIAICIPKDKADIYPINEILDSDFYRNYPGPLKIALGESVDGAMVIGDLEKWNHVLIAGVTRSGKSNFIHVMLKCLMQQPSDLVNLILMDLKRVELKRYNHTKNLIKPVITDELHAKIEVTHLVTEMIDRFELLERYNCRNIQEYHGKGYVLPYLVVIIDEIEVLLMGKEKDVVENQLIKIATRGAAAGIYIVATIHKPSASIITTDLKSNMDTRISFKVASNTDSRVILDEPGAEKLRMGGDMLLRDGDEDGLLRLQCCYISKQEIDINIERNSRQFGKVGIHEEQKQLDYIEAEFTEVEEVKEYEPEFDRLYNEAIEYVKENKKCNQWQLRNYLHKGIEFVDRILEKLINDNYITKYKIGNYYEFKGDL